jgi:nucleoside-diphosphate-sugar epimerase
MNNGRASYPPRLKTYRGGLSHSAGRDLPSRQMKPAPLTNDRTNDACSIRLLVTGGNGVLGRALSPLASAAGHELVTPTRDQLDLFDPVAVAHATQGVDAVLHLATRIRPLEQLGDPVAWRDNDRLRADASRILVDAALTAGVAIYVQPTVTFVYPAEVMSPKTARPATSQRSCARR